MLLIAMCFYSLIPFLYFFSSNGTILFILRILHGFATAIFAPVVSALISDFTDKHNRGKVLSTYSSASMFGEMIGPIIGGWLLFLSGFFLPFLASGIIGIISLFFVIFWSKDFILIQNTTDKQTHIQFIKGINNILSNKSILLVSLVECGQLFANGTFECFLPIYAKNHIYLNSWQIGILFGVTTITTIIFKPFWGALSDIFGRTLQISLGLILGGIAFILIPLSHSFLYILFIAAIYGFAISIVTSSTSPYITDLASKSNYGSAHGVFGTITDIGHASGSILAGLIISAFNYDYLFLSLGIFLIIFGLVFRFLILPNNYLK